MLGNPEKIKTEESQWNWTLFYKKCLQCELNVTGEHPSFDFDFKPDVIVDGILGTGITGEIREPYASAIELYQSILDCLQVGSRCSIWTRSRYGKHGKYLYVKC